MPTTAPGLSHETPPFELASRTAPSPRSPGVADGVRQDRPRRHRDRSGAAVDGGDHHPAQAAQRSGRASPARAGTRAGRPAAQARCWAALAGGAAADDRRAGRAAWTAATRLPGWTNAWTAPVRARMDMMSTGVRTPVGDPHRRRRRRRGSTRWARRCRRAAARCPARAAPSTRGWAARRRLSFDLDRAGAGAPRRRSGARPRGRATWCWRAARSARSRRPTPTRRRPLRVRLALERALAAQAAAGHGARRDACAPAATARASRSRWRCWGGRRFVSQPATLRAERGELCGVRPRRRRRRHGSRGLRRARARALDGDGRASGRSLLRARRAHRMDRAIPSCSPPGSGGCS